jgi:hypothetical protein
MVERWWCSWSALRRQCGAMSVPVRIRVRYRRERLSRVSHSCSVLMVATTCKLNRFFRELPSCGVRSANGIEAYTRDVMLFCRFLHDNRIRVGAGGTASATRCSPTCRCRQVCG